jgi:hypothetical protein
VIDERAAADPAVLGQLLAAADVCVTSDVPEQAVSRSTRDTLLGEARNPRLVTLRMPPYLGARPAPWAGGRESNELLSAAMGISMRQSSFGDGPVDPVYPHLLYEQGLWAAGCATFLIDPRPRRGVDKSQASRALKALETAGIVQRDPRTLEYRLGWRLPSLMLATKSMRVLQFALDTMRTLSAMYPETAEFFCVRRADPGHALYSMAVDGSTKKHPWSANGAPCYRASTGRALLSGLDVYQLRKAYPNGARAVGERAPPHPHGQAPRGGADGSAQGWLRGGRKRA